MVPEVQLQANRTGILPSPTPSVSLCLLKTKIGMNTIFKEFTDYAIKRRDLLSEAEGPCYSFSRCPMLFPWVLANVRRLRVMIKLTKNIYTATDLPNLCSRFLTQISTLDFLRVRLMPGSVCVSLTVN